MQQEAARPGPRIEARTAGLPKLPVLDCDQPAEAGHAEQKGVAHEVSPRHAGAAPSRLPRLPSAASPRPGAKR